MIVDEAHRLHEGVDGRRADKRPAAALQVLAERGRFRRRPEAHQRVPRDATRARLPPRFPLPDVAGQRSMFGAQIHRAPGVVDRGLDLAAVPDNAAVAEEPSDIAGTKSGHARNVEVSERAAELVTLPENREPTQPGLKPFKTHLLEQPIVVSDGDPPLVIIVLAP